jgi:hypothetical protein
LAEVIIASVKIVRPELHAASRGLAASGRINLPLQIAIEKLHHDRVHHQLVLQFDDAVAFVGEGESGVA